MARDDEDFFRPEPDPPIQQRIQRLIRGPFKKVLEDDEAQEDESDAVIETVEYEDDRVRTDVSPAVPMPTTINLFQHPDAHPFVLDLALLRKYGPEWMQWEPETLEGRIRIDFRSTLSQLNLDKLHAVANLHLVDTFWDHWTVFSPCAQALTMVPPDFRVMQALTVPQLLIAVDTAEKIRSGMEYSLEVRTYMELCYLYDGMACPIAPLDDLLDIDASEYEIDCESINERWDDVRSSGKAPKGGTVEDEQLRRMLEAHQLLEENRQLLQDQLPLLYNA
jgi:hypothetical protein